MKSILIGILTSILLLVLYYFAIAFVSLDLDFRQWNSDCRALFVVMGFFIGAAGGFAAAIGHNIYMKEK